MAANQQKFFELLPDIQRQDINPEAKLHSADVRRILIKVLKTLDPWEEQLLRLRYQIEPWDEDKTKALVLKRFGRINRKLLLQIERKALRKLHHSTRSDIIRQHLEPGDL